MKSLMTSTAAVAVALSFAGGAAAQSGSALGETSLRPADITCQDLMSASESERAGLVYFIAGYHAAMQGGATGDGGAGAGGGGQASGGAADASGATTSGTTGAANTAAAGTSGGAGGATATTGGTDTAAAGGSGSGSGGATTGGTTTGSGGTDTAAAGASGGGTGTGAGGSAGGGGDVQMARSFFAMPVSDILTACANDATMSAADAITTAQGSAQ
ncbi:MAG TPA: HdeA/HdeB family chaperone [Afifellaceae bacterium]|nr:HdeA/HdeB family chaperone [Afifellaceae bacterium]